MQAKNFEESNLFLTVTLLHVDICFQNLFTLNLTLNPNHNPNPIYHDQPGEGTDTSKRS